MWDIVGFVLRAGLGLGLLWYSIALVIYGRRWDVYKLIVFGGVFGVFGIVWLFAAFGWFTDISRLFLFIGMLLFWALHRDIDRIIAKQNSTFRDMLFFRSDH